MLSSPSAFTSPPNKCSVVLLVLCIFLTSKPVLGHRLPRGFTPALYCSACRSIARDIRAVHNAASHSEMIDSGSFRLSESGKQPYRKLVPLRHSELHAVQTLDSACVDISSRYLLLDEMYDTGPFVPVVLRDHHQLENANFTSDCPPVRALRDLCVQLVDEHEDALKSLLKEVDQLDAEQWIDLVCDSAPKGIVGACNLASEPGPMEVALDLARQQLQAHNANHNDLASESANSSDQPNSSAASQAQSSQSQTTATDQSTRGMTIAVDPDQQLPRSDRLQNRMTDTSHAKDDL